MEYIILTVNFCLENELRFSSEALKVTPFNSVKQAEEVISFSLVLFQIS